MKVKVTPLITEAIKSSISTSSSYNPKYHLTFKSRFNSLFLYFLERRADMSRYEDFIVKILKKDIMTCLAK